MSKFKVDVYLSSDPGFVVELDTEDSPEVIFENPLIKAAIDDAAQMSHPNLHWRHGNDVIESNTAAEVVDAFLKTGEISDAENIIDGWMDEDEYYRGLFREYFDTSDDMEGWGAVIAQLQAALRSDSCSDDDIEEAFEAAALEALREADDSTPFDQMKQALNIGVVYVAGVEAGLGVDDLNIEAAMSSGVNSINVRPNEALANLLRFVNISSDSYREAVRIETGVDLHHLATSTEAKGKSEYWQKRAYEVSAEWQAFDVQSDPTHPPLITPEQVIELLDNASYGGVPVCYGYLEPKKFLDLSWNQPGAMIEFTATDKGKPMIGIQDFMNGSGDFVQTDQPVRLPLNHRNWHADGVRYRYGIGSCYDLYTPAFKVGVSVVEAPADPSDDHEALPQASVVEGRPTL